MQEKGYVYILTNPSFREDWVKIGKSSRPVDVRSKELDNTAVPLPFEIYATVKSNKYSYIESSLHKILTDLADKRIRKNREFFNIKPEEALTALYNRPVAQVLTPIFEEQFHDHSYGFRPNRCAQQAVLKALEMMNDGHSWIVDIDLAKFFDTVDHDKLMTIFGRTIKDGDVISVVRKFLASGVMIDDEYEDTIVGTPQGGLCGVPHNPPYADTFIMLSQSA